MCSVRIDDSYSSWALYAECEDADGDDARGARALMLASADAPEDGHVLVARARPLEWYELRFELDWARRRVTRASVNGVDVALGLRGVAFHDPECAGVDRIELYNYGAPDRVRAWWSDLQLLPF